MIDFVLSFLVLASIRLAFRVIRERFFTGEKIAIDASGVWELWGQGMSALRWPAKFLRNVFWA